MGLCLLAIFLLAFTGGLAVDAAAQPPPPAPSEKKGAGPAPAGRVRVFLDCGDCFQDFLRTDVQFVDFVRDRADSDVHVLITDIRTGSGGREYTVTFTGGDRFPGVDKKLTTVTRSSDADDVVRRQLANTLRVGLIGYVTSTGVPRELALTVNLGRPSEDSAASTDKWNNWVFSLEGSASVDAEESNSERHFGAEIGADRITPNWKITLGIEADSNKEEFDLDDDEAPVEVIRKDQEFRWLAVKALGEHWSVGAEGNLGSSTYQNTKLSLSAAPAIEFNVFPYSMYTRRQLRAKYSLGFERLEYYEETIFLKTAETLPRHQMTIAFEQREQWGSLNARAEWSQYLHDLSKSRLELDGEVSLRLFRGLSLSTEMNASRIHDQLSLPRRSATEQEILLRQRQLASGYEYRLAFNVRYTFGSIFSSVVNPRFGR
jgi:hypothetical protein